MEVYLVILIGIALGMDAFGINIIIGINSAVSKIDKIQYALSCAFFQFLLCFLGGTMGNVFQKYVAPVSNTFAGIVIGCVGILMIINGIKNKEETIFLKNSIKIILGISVSIDSLVIGFSVFKDISNIISLSIFSLLIGLITFTMCIAASFISNNIKKIDFVKKYCCYLSGIILILFAISFFFNQNFI